MRRLDRTQKRRQGGRGDAKLAKYVITRLAGSETAVGRFGHCHYGETSALAQTRRGDSPAESPTGAHALRDHFDDTLLIARQNTMDATLLVSWASAEDYPEAFARRDPVVLTRADLSNHGKLPDMQGSNGSERRLEADTLVVWCASQMPLRWAGIVVRSGPI
ncbi:hypothetical protein PCL_11378 [Purpureocillium lilacinum]|uniref:Uncharacterized protein n=1 Tax=Purpureocillium lilacinum TaxID=33203 RepID=A0A2U3E9W5_PURLI|nr:hypothetical protein PCL_11378 [Purpureocillium lilacinum]